MLTKPIPKKLKEEMGADTFYKKCCISGIKSRPPYSIIEWHHGFRWQGKRLNEKWAIVPLLKEIHRKADTRTVKEKIDWIILNRADETTLKKYSKAEYLIKKRDRLNKIYGTY